MENIKALVPYLPSVGVFGLSALSLAVAPSLVPSIKKPFGTFTSFYPFYLSQHAKLGTKLLHAIGTSFVVVTAVREPKLVVALFAAAFSGRAIFPFLRSFDTGIAEFITSIGSFFIVGKNLGMSNSTLLSVPAFAYSFAWVSHFFYERNTPATFIYPSFSLVGDFVMFYELLIGRHWKFDKTIE